MVQLQQVSSVENKQPDWKWPTTTFLDPVTRDCEIKKAVVPSGPRQRWETGAVKQVSAGGQQDSEKYRKVGGGNEKWNNWEAMVAVLWLPLPRPFNPLPCSHGSQPLSKCLGKGDSCWWHLQTLHPEKEPRSGSQWSFCHSQRPMAWGGTKELWQALLPPQAPPTPPPSDSQCCNCWSLHELQEHILADVGWCHRSALNPEC